MYSQKRIGVDTCEGKKIYDKKGAKTVANFRKKQGCEYLRPYQCPECGYWHLSHIKNYDEQYQTRKIKGKTRKKERRWKDSIRVW